MFKLYIIRIGRGSEYLKRLLIRTKEMYISNRRYIENNCSRIKHALIHSHIGCTYDLLTIRSSNPIVGYAVVYILRLIGHTHDRESPIQNFSTAPKKLGAHISSPVWPPKPTEFVSYLGNLRCDAFTALKSLQSARNESFLAGSDNFHRVLTAI